jgi:hypothetical protein
MSRGGLFAAGGRFVGGTDELMQKFNDSLPFDRRLWHADITGSKAYANALARSGIITTGAAAQREPQRRMWRIHFHGQMKLRRSSPA